MTGTLYVVSTPIGNLEDMTFRAVRTLREVDFIAAEDTRVTAKLLRHFGIETKQVSYYEHNRRERGEEILTRLLAGESCALVSDAGTPAISDPGEELVVLCRERRVPVVPVPGASALIAALTVSSLPTGRFCFEGFLSTNGKNRREHLAALKDEGRTMIFYEAPHKLMATLKALAEAFGDRTIAVCRELTKLYEEVRVAPLPEAVLYFEEHAPRGEFVLVIQGAEAEADDGAAFAQALALAKEYVRDGLSKRDAVRRAALCEGVPRNQLYREMIGGDGDEA